MPPPKPLLPAAAMIAANLTLATVPILVRLAQAEAMPTMAVATLRLLFAVLLLTPYILSRHRAELRRLTRRDAALIGLTGFSTAMFFVFFFTSLEHTSVLIASVFSGTSPLWVALAEVVVLKAVLRRNIWVGLALVLGGSALFAFSGGGGAVSLGDNPVLGGAMAVIAAMTSAGYMLPARTVRRRLSALAFLWMMLLVALAIMLALCLVTGTPLTGYSSSGYIWILLMAVGAQIIGQASISYALAHLPPTFISIVIQLSVIISAGLALLLFQEVPQALQIAASVVIVAGVLRVILPSRPSGRTAPA
jgi:drug/metabolite transporter (DMT)-like permease